MKTITCKLSEQLHAQLEAVAREEGVSKSQIVRKSLESWMTRRRINKAPRAYDLVKDLCGSVDGLTDLLTNPESMKDFGR